MIRALFSVKKNKRGFSLVEVLIAVAMFSMVFLLGWQLYNTTYLYSERWQADWELISEMWLIAEAIKRTAMFSSNVIAVNNTSVSKSIVLSYWPNAENSELVVWTVWSDGRIEFCSSNTGYCSVLYNNVDFEESYFENFSIPGENYQMVRARIVLRKKDRRFPISLTYRLGLSGYVEE